MSVYITGDCHGDWSKIYNFNNAKKGDFVIVCGDFGIWHDSNGLETEKLNILENGCDFTILFCDGNHENFSRLYSNEFPIVDFCGGQAHQIKGNIYHLMRGNVFELDDTKFFVFGGAKSQDIKDGILDPMDFSTEKQFEEAYFEWRKRCKSFRVRGISWWDLEMPSEAEMEYGKQILLANNNEVDYVITHCLPYQIENVLSGGMYKPDYLTRYFDEIMENNKFTRWYSGHYHLDRVIMGKFVVMYDRFEQVV